MRKSLSVYIHIPFCVRKCLYCDFLSGSATDLEKEWYVQALCQELKAWGRYTSENYQLNTIYIGGGTPSCLLPEQLFKIGDVLQSCFCSADELEFSTEANPGTVTSQHVKAWKKMGVNRISLGLQSAQDEELRRLGRIHTYDEFLKTYELLRKHDFSNINIDIMADIPGQTYLSYQDTLKRIAKLQPEHISSYSLIIEPGTPFYEMEEKGELLREDEDIDREMYEFTRDFLREQGYERYEISNYAKEGKECRHNCVYWQGGEYIGTGIGAASLFQGKRFSNSSNRTKYQAMTADLPSYLETEWNNNVQKKQTLDGSIKEGQIPWEFSQYELQTMQSQIEEFMFLGLRMTQGVSKKIFEERFHKTMDEIYGKVLSKLLSLNLLAESGNRDRIYLTDRGIDVSNCVLSEFLFEE